MTFVHRNILIEGRVQGVYFRASTQKEARKLEVTGFVRNEPGGKVYVEAEGEEENVLQLIKWCKIGPPAAKVASVEVKEGKICNFSSFRVVH